MAGKVSWEQLDRQKALPFEPLPRFRHLAADARLADCRGKRIGVLVVTYNAVTTLKSVLKRIPPAVWENVEEVVVFDDASADATFDLAIGIKALLDLPKLKVLRHPENLGYGGNQQAGYRYFIEKGFDICVLLHGDGQYAPEMLAQMYAPLVSQEADAVFGSRMMRGVGGALKGGMPVYKYAGNRILTKFENAALGMKLTEFHSGYRAYNLHALASIDFSRMTSDFHFDTEIIIKLNHQRFRIVEIPIPTYYGEELCYVNGLRYARDVYRAVRRYQRTIRSVERCEEFSEYFVHYPMKESRYSSHDYLRRFFGRNKDLLDVGCGEGFLARQLTEDGHRVSGIDMLDVPRHRESFVTYDRMDLDDVQSHARLAARKDRFDYVILLDVLEHLRQPEPLLRTAAALLKPHGKIILSVPNVANITVRLQLLLGSFDYTERGILDRTHLRFYTRRTIRETIERCGLRSLEEKTTVVPVHLALGVPAANPLMRLANACLKGMTQGLPGLFGYQIMHLIDCPMKTQQAFSATKDLEQLRDKLNDFGTLTAGQVSRHGAAQSDSAAH
jgi:2-polyprenyl-3-methyl-5-hydroxy-6-metoxy-1,4-benzoquinol methylase